MVILVDRENNKIGTEEKIQAHLKSLLHRAFSIFIFKKTRFFNSDQQLRESQWKFHMIKRLCLAQLYQTHYHKLIVKMVMLLRGHMLVM